MSDDILSRLTDAIEAELRRQATVDEGPWVGGHLSTGLEVDGDIDLKFLARAALTAMREPTAEMIGDVHDTMLYHVKGNELETAKLVWERMIEVALDEGRG